MPPGGEKGRAARVLNRPVMGSQAKPTTASPPRGHVPQEPWRTQFMRPMRKTTLATRLMRWIGGTVVAVTVIVLLLVAYFGRRFAVSELEWMVKRDAFTTTEMLNGRLALVESTARMMALDMEDGGIDDETLVKTYLPQVVESTPLVMGAALIRCAPEAPPSQHHLCYVYQDGKQQHTLNAEHIRDSEWYRRVLAENSAVWSKPYRHPSLATRVMTYAVPIHQNGKLVGVACADISITELESEMSHMAHNNHGYVIGIGTNGEFYLSSRAPNLEQSLQTHPLPPQVFEKDSGLVELAADPCYGEKAWLYHRWLERYDAIFCLVYPARDVLYLLHYVEAITVVIALVFILVVMLLLGFVMRNITAPVRALEEAAHAASTGNFDVKMPDPGTNDELAAIPISFNRMMANLRDYVARLQTVTAEKQRVSSEMNIAREVQEAFLDRSRWPHPASMDVQAQCVEAREVGGDFYDFFTLDAGRIGLVLGDSSGHGMGAALFMAVCRTLVRAYAPSSATPAECLEAVSHRLYEENETMMFVTTIYGVLDTWSGTLFLSNAGHPPPLLLRADGSLETVPSPRGRPLGIRPDSRYQVQELKMRPGDRLVLYSDGVTEAENGTLARFESHRLETALRGATSGTCTDIVGAVDSAVRAFAAGAEASDDRSVMVVEWKGPRIELPRCLDSVEKAQAWIEDVLPSAPRKQMLELQMVLEEVMVNVITHGSGKESDLIWIAASVGVDEVLLTIADEGPEFDPTAPRAQASPRVVGGHGIDLIRAAVDEMTYSRKGNRNILRVRKMLGKKAPMTCVQNEADGGSPCR